MALEELCASLQLAPQSSFSTAEWKVLSNLKGEQERWIETKQFFFSVSTILTVSRNWQISNMQGTPDVYEWKK